MISEDDTFKALRRTPVTQLITLRIDWLNSRLDKRTFDEFLEAHGWIYDDFIVAKLTQ